MDEIFTTSPVGGGRVVQAPQTGDVVKISSMWYDGYLGAARPGA